MKMLSIFKCVLALAVAGVLVTACKMEEGKRTSNEEKTEKVEIKETKESKTGNAKNER